MQRGLCGDLKVSFDPVPPAGVAALHRAHPIVATLANLVSERTLDGGSGPGTLARCGAWPAEGLTVMVTLALIRIRHRVARRRQEADFLLAEEVGAIAFEGTSDMPAAVGEAALAHFDRAATGTPPDPVRKAQVVRALSRIAERSDAVDEVARERAGALGKDHDRLRTAAGRVGVATLVDPVLPPALVGVSVMLPEARP